MDAEATLKVILLIFALFASFNNAKECFFNVSVIKVEEQLFNKTNYEKKCEGSHDYDGSVIMCNGYFLNPKCICSYYMYELEIHDICDTTDPRKNGSLKHTSIAFCKKYSHSKNGPCQNNGILTGWISDEELALDAKCVCKKNYSGDFCDVYNGAIKCKEMSPKDSASLPDCGKLFRGRYCLLTVHNVKLQCDSDDIGPGNLKDCSDIPQSAFDKYQTSGSKSANHADLVVLMVSLVFVSLGVEFMSLRLRW